MSKLRGVIWFVGLVIMLGCTGCESMLESLMFSKKSYASQVTVLGSLMSQEQVAQLFDNPTNIQTPLGTNELHEGVYLVVRFSNLGGEYFWGTLDCINPITGHYLLDVRWNEGATYAIPLGHLTGEQKLKSPNLTFRWKHLYVK